MAQLSFVLSVAVAASIHMGVIAFVPYHLEDYVDTTADPCEDFFRFSCGTFIKTAREEYPNETITLDEDLQEKLNNITEEILTNAKVSPDNPRAVNIAIQAYAACIEGNHEDETVNLMFDEIGGWPLLQGNSWKNRSWAEIEAVATGKFGLNAVIGFDVITDPRNASQYIIEVSMPGIPWYDPCDTESLKESILELGKCLGNADKEEIEKDADMLVNFISKLLKVKVPYDHEEYYSYNKMSVRHLQRKYPFVDWLSYIRNVISTYSEEASRRIITLSTKVLLRNSLFFDRFNELMPKHNHPDAATEADNRAIVNYIGLRLSENLQVSCPEKATEACENTEKNEIDSKEVEIGTKEDEDKDIDNEIDVIADIVDLIVKDDKEDDSSSEEDKDNTKETEETEEEDNEIKAIEDIIAGMWSILHEEKNMIDELEDKSGEGSEESDEENSEPEEESKTTSGEAEETSQEEGKKEDDSWSGQMFDAGCAWYLQRNFNFALEYIFLQKYGFNVTKITEMITYIQKAFSVLVKRSGWIKNKAMKFILMKMRSMKLFTAFPPWLLSAKELDDYYKELPDMTSDNMMNAINILKFQNLKMLSQLDTEPAAYKWMPQQSLRVVNAYHYPTKNAMVLPFAILSSPYYDNDRPMYVNFGMVGSIIGHELTHAFDSGGRFFDPEGNINKTWLPSGFEKAFMSKTECFVEQYGNFTVEGLAINGYQTLPDNIADCGGIRQSYLAYKHWAEDHGKEPSLPGFENYTTDQLFFMTFGTLWCVSYGGDDRYLKGQVAYGSHSPHPVRVWGAVSNMKEFAEAFDCPTGSPMNPEHKCVLW